MTIKFLKENEVKHLVYCFDHKDPSFRTKIYKDYKANRGEAPEDLVVQIPYIKKLTEALGIPALEKKGYEADDLIGSLAVQSAKKGWQAVIVSGDKDFSQVVSDKVILFDPMREKHYDKTAVQDKWGVLPHQMVDYLAIVGDSSDNIPGVRGLGPKGAVKLLKEYGDLESIYKNVKTLPDTVKEKLLDSKKEAFLSQKLAKIVLDIDFSKQKNNWKREPFKQTALKSLLQELGFKSFEKKLCPEESGKAAEPQPVKRLSSNLKVHCHSFSEITKRVQSYSKVWVFCKDNNWFMAHKNHIISLEDHNLQKIGSLFAEKRVQWLGYDLKKNWKVFNCTHPVCYWDSMLAGYLIESAFPGDLQKMSARYLKKDIEEEKLAPGEIYQLHKLLRKKLQKLLEDFKLEDFYQNVELKLSRVLFEMENKGVFLDKKELKTQEEEIDSHLNSLEKNIFKLSEKIFNLASPKQLADVLFTDLKLKPLRKTKTGYSTDGEVLNKLKHQHPVIPFILEHRELFKLKSTYVSALPQLINKSTKRVHTHFRQAQTATGRLSSINPNLQNIPIKTPKGQKVRKAFIAPPGFNLISADYSQIELRILAKASGDKALCRAFAEDLDIHKATASEIYQLPLKKVTEDLRRQAKAVNFGLMYGQGAYTLSESLSVSVNEAQEIITKYFKRFKSVKEYMEAVKKRALKKGYVETLFGRRRVIKELQSDRAQIRKMGERIAVNTPIQGTASDLVKMAMVRLRDSLYSSLLVQIHDELLFECKSDLLEEEKIVIKDIMENVVSWKIPLKVNIAGGKTWLAVHGA